MQNELEHALIIERFYRDDQLIKVAVRYPNGRVHTRYFFGADGPAAACSAGDEA